MLCQEKLTVIGWSGIKMRHCLNKVGIEIYKICIQTYPSNANFTAE